MVFSVLLLVLGLVTLNGSYGSNAQRLCELTAHEEASRVALIPVHSSQKAQTVVACNRHAQRG